jgi:hypothetical protein
MNALRAAQLPLARQQSYPSRACGHSAFAVSHERNLIFTIVLHMEMPLFSFLYSV